MSYSGEWIGAPVVIGVVVFLCVASFAPLGLAFVVVIAAGGFAALVGASVATPYLLARHLRGRWLIRSAEASARISTEGPRLGAARLRPRPKATRSR